MSAVEGAEEPSTTSELVCSSPRTALDVRALCALLAQHLSSTWQQRSFEFASSLFLISLFPHTTLFVSLSGFFTTSTAILLSGSVGRLVDITPRLRFVRGTVVAQKGTLAVSYAVFLGCFLRLEGAVGRGESPKALEGLFAMLVVLAMVQNLAAIGMSVAVERDWVTCIAAGNSANLTRLNTYLRRIDLLSKLLAPLFVSLLTTAASNTFAAAFLLGMAAASMTFEFIWINYVYRRFPMLSVRPADRPSSPSSFVPPVQRTWREWAYFLPSWFKVRIVAEGRAWLVFVRQPVFLSSLAISLLYLTVLSFDGSLLAYLKSHDYADSYVAGMRGVGVVSGLLGTMAMPVLEKRIGLVRAGTWSVLSEVITLIPAVLAFFVIAPAPGKTGRPFNDFLLFSGMALSRIGLWSFDLCQLKELQQALDDNPRRNSIMALQFSLQNVFDLLKYIVTIILNKPSQFKWAAVISFASVICGAVSYLAYAHKERGHLVHLEWAKPLLRPRKMMLEGREVEMEPNS